MANKSTNTATNIILHPTITDIPVNDIETFIKQKINVAWQSYWDSVPSFNKLKKIKKCTKKWNIPQNLRRRQKVTLTIMRTGHSFLTNAFLIS